MLSRRIFTPKLWAGLRSRPFSAVTADCAAPSPSDPSVESSSTAASVWPVRPRPPFREIRENPQLYKNVCALRKVADNIDEVVQLYDQSRDMKTRLDQLRSLRHAKPKANIPKEEIIAAGKLLKEQIKILEEEYEALERKLFQEGLAVPNLLHESVVDLGSKPKIRGWIGTKPTFDFKPHNHLDLANKLNGVDFEGPALSVGHKFYILKNDLALLELALVNWAMNKLVTKGFTPLLVPDVAKEPVVAACGYQPRTEASQVYRVHGGLCLVGTGEISVAGMLADQILPDLSTPRKYAAFSHCFRTEIGAAGLQTKGLYRVHQFSKVEMFGFTQPNDSQKLYEEFVDIQRELYDELELHCQVLLMPPDDLGSPAICKTDIEVWFPGREEYGEISSCSNCTDFQSRRLNIRYKNASNETELIHTINGTAAAIPRLLIAILENNQKADGSIAIPKTLQPFMGGRSMLTAPLTNL